MRNIVVVLHPHRAHARQAALNVCSLLHAENVTPVMSHDDYAGLVSYEGEPSPPIKVLSANELETADPELIMVLGGDGTILRAAGMYHETAVPIMGINLGHVGFLAESERKELEQATQAAIMRQYFVEQRMALDISVTQDGHLLHRDWALNEATIEKGRYSSMIEVVVGVDYRPVSSFGCDGVIFATPTGSTAYAFSAGGPVVWPEVEALLMIPISAHALFTKPLVVSPRSRLGVEFIPTQSHTDAQLWCDGQLRFKVPAGARVEAVRAQKSVSLARLNRDLFTDRLVAKFQLPVSGWRGPQA